LRLFVEEEIQFETEQNAPQCREATRERFAVFGSQEGFLSRKFDGICWSGKGEACELLPLQCSIQWAVETDRADIRGLYDYTTVWPCGLMTVRELVLDELFISKEFDTEFAAQSTASGQPAGMPPSHLSMPRPIHNERARSCVQHVQMLTFFNCNSNRYR
jgi:hypothetical protein